MANQVRDLVEVVRAAKEALDSRCGASRPAGYTYAVRLVGTSMIKIGQAQDPVERIACLQRMCGLPIELVGLSHDWTLETYLHGVHAQQRRHGEWFELSESPIATCHDQCAGCRSIEATPLLVGTLSEDAGASETARARNGSRSRSAALYSLQNDVSAASAAALFGISRQAAHLARKKLMAGRLRNRPGRPRKFAHRVTVGFSDGRKVTVRLTDEERAAILVAAQGAPLPTWIREVAGVRSSDSAYRIRELVLAAVEASR